MLRFLLTALLLSMWIINVTHAGGWAVQMFLRTQHDFGTVAPGADVSCKFVFRNVFKNDIRLIGVRSSCGCTMPLIVTPTETHVLKTYERGHILAKFNTRSFSGRRRATLTVKVEFFDEYGKGHLDEIQLHVRGHIRKDLFFDPLTLLFNDARQGVEYEQTAIVTQTGKAGWKITEAQSQKNWMEVQIKEDKRLPQQVSYKLIARLKKNAPVGYFRERIDLITNERGSQPESFYIEGRVAPEISITPARLDFGDISHGKQATMKIIVRGIEPFKIVGSDCSHPCITAKFSEDSQKLHIVQITFSADSASGTVEVPVTIHTENRSCPSVVVRVRAKVISGE